MPATRTAVALVAGLALAFAAAPAGASTITGRVGGGKLPKAGKGFTTVRAVAAGSLRIVGVAKVRSRRYRLTVPAGRYWMFAATTPLRGKAGVERSAGKIRIRKGKRKAVPVSLRKPKGKRKRPKLPNIPGLPTAGAAVVAVKYPAVWVQHFTVTGGSADHGALRKGIADMLMTQLGAPLKAACGGILVEREKLDFILAQELLVTGRPPSTARLIVHNREVSGRLAVTGATTTLTVDVKNVVTGTTRSVTRSAATDRFFELEASVVQEVARLICGDKPPGHYAGSFSGSVSAVDGPEFETLSWSGNVRLKFSGHVFPENAGDPPGEYAIYELESGSIHVTLDGAIVDGQCTYHGEADVTIVPAPGGEAARVQQGVDEPTYALSADLPTDTPPLPVTSSCGTPSTHPLADMQFMGTPTSQRASSSTLVHETTVAIGPGTHKWAWSLAPEAG